MSFYFSKVNFTFAIVMLLAGVALAAASSLRKTVRTSEKAVSESATASVTASRLTFYRSLDALSRQFNLSADSISIIFLNESREFPTAFSLICL